MSKAKKIFSCSNCDAQFPRWQGQCSQCGKWGTLTEEIIGTKKEAKKTFQVKPGKVFNFSEIKISHNKTRQLTNIEEFDRTVGGGLVAGGITLIGGEPGIGKSTLILQVADKIADTVYVSGEESASQVKMRLDRLRLDPKAIDFLGETDIEVICATIKKEKPKLAVIDSIQTVYLDEVDSEPGSISQIKACTTKLIEVAKQENIAVIIVGHVTKAGDMSGPKTLEHLVDTVLYLEGDKHHAYRVLRAVKNRFGSTDEIGVFDMRQTGLVGIKNPSEIFLTNKNKAISGSAITTTLEGSRAFLAEIQALTNFTSFGYPQRKSVGVSLNRLQILIAVLGKRCRLDLSKKDVYLNVVGGLNITDPSADLAIAMAIASSALDRPLDNKTLFIGEIGLAGEIRLIGQLAKRVKEAQKFGFKEVVVGKMAPRLRSVTGSEIKITQLEYLDQVINKFLK